MKQFINEFYQQTDITTNHAACLAVLKVIFAFVRNKREHSEPFDLTCIFHGNSVV
jgi:hypothetical protein